MARCVYCGESAGLVSRMCRECKTLMRRVEDLRGHVGFGEFLDGLESTGIAREKIIAFLKADPDGKGSVQDQITAEMTTELMQIMGIAGRQTPQAVKQIRNAIGKDPK